MTYESLKNEVVALGFEQSTDNEDFLLFAVNRAQQLIGTDFPIEENVTLYQAPTEPRILYREAPATLSLGTAYALSLRTYGGGTVTVQNAEKTQRYPLDSNLLFFQIQIPKDSLVTLSGMLFDVAIYEDIYKNPSEIPVYYDMIPYELDKLLPGFICLTDDVRDEQGRIIDGTLTEGSLLLIPRSRRGQMRLRYRRRERPITPEEDTVDIHASAEVLLPLLSASYLWLEDEPEKAQYYMSLYREGVARLHAQERKSMHTGYGDVLGWA